MKRLYRLVRLNNMYKAQIWHWTKLRWVNVSSAYRSNREDAEDDINRLVKTFENKKTAWWGFR